ncbi:MAG: hypothetical protein QGI45_00485 [Myxococcota bacterium]|nr:hypothetical protein [Myxococcota bacterium]
MKLRSEKSTKAPAEPAKVVPELPVDAKSTIKGVEPDPKTIARVEEALQKNAARRETAPAPPVPQSNTAKDAQTKRRQTAEIQEGDNAAREYLQHMAQESANASVVEGSMRTNRRDAKAGRRLPYAIGAGGVLGYMGLTTGVSTYVHEYWGHVLLGGELTHDYDHGHEPTWEVHAFDESHHIGDASTPEGKIDALLDWVSRPHTQGDGVLGYARFSTSHAHPNELGEHMGEDGADAWLSMAGPLAELGMCSLAYLAGNKVADKRPVLGYTIMSMGMASHATHCLYPLSAAQMTHGELLEASHTGHDYANIAVKMSEVTGVDATTLAVGTAAAYIGFLPAVAVGMYLHQKRHNETAVSTSMAMQHWFSKAKDDPEIGKTFEEKYESYPDREKLVEKAQAYSELFYDHVKDPDSVDEHALAEAYVDLDIECQRLNSYIFRSFDKKTQGALKNEVLQKWNELLASDPYQQAIERLSVAGMGLAATTPIVKTLGQTIVPAVGGVGSAMSASVPVLASFGAVRDGYKLFKDLQTPSHVVPTKAKVASAGKYASSFFGAAAITAAVTVPGAALAFVPAAIGCVASSLGFGYARHKILKGRLRESARRETYMLR